LKKRVRGIRPIERAAEGSEDDEGEAVRGYCAAVRAALTDDGRPPLVASGLRLHERLEQIAASLDRVEAGVGRLPKGLLRLRQLLRRGLENTAALWPGVRQAYRWVRRVVRLLENQGRAPVRTLRRRLSRLLTRLRQEAATTTDAALVGQLRHFVKVTRSYRPGLFGCYEVADLPRTNNDLEQLFGSHRYHERRASGRKVASPGLVVSGAVRVVSGLATRLRPDEGLVLSAGYVPQWQQLRAQLERRREARRRQRRFRHAPALYLAKLEKLCLKQSLLS